MRPCLDLQRMDTSHLLLERTVDHLVSLPERDAQEDIADHAHFEVYPYQPYDR